MNNSGCLESLLEPSFFFFFAKDQQMGGNFLSASWRRVHTIFVLGLAERRKKHERSRQLHVRDGWFIGNSAFSIDRRND